MEELKRIWFRALISVIVCSVETFSLSTNPVISLLAKPVTQLTLRCSCFLCVRHCMQIPINVLAPSVCTAFYLSSFFHSLNIYVSLNFQSKLRWHSVLKQCGFRQTSHSSKWKDGSTFSIIILDEMFCNMLLTLY